MASALPREVLPKVFAFVPRDLQCLSALRVTSRDAKESVDARWCEARYWTECLVKDIIDFVPDDLQCLSSLRVASQNSKGCVEARWWKKQVRCMKDFVDQHEHLFADDPEMDEVDEQQEDFARNILLWVQPFLVNQPWRIEGPAQPTGDSATDEVTPQAAHMNLRRALVDLSHFEQSSDLSCYLLARFDTLGRLSHRLTWCVYYLVLSDCNDLLDTSTLQQERERNWLHISPELLLDSRLRKCRNVLDQIRKVPRSRRGAFFLCLPNQAYFLSANKIT